MAEEVVRRRGEWGPTIEQLDEIGSLRASAQQLRDQIAAEKAAQQQALSPASAAAAASTAALHEEIARLQDAADGYTRRIEEEKLRIAELERDLVEVHAQIASQRARVGSTLASTTADALSRGLGVLETRLQQAQRRHNESTLANRRMREEIDSMRLDRLNNERLAAKLDAELAEKRAQMSAIVDASQRAYAARDRAQAEMETLKAQAEGELAAFDAEWKNLNKTINADAQLSDLGAGRRASRADGRRANAPADGAGTDGGGEGGGRGKAWAGGKERGAAAAADRIDSYADALRRIHAATGIGEIEKLVGAFLHAEDHNLALYNYAAELADEVAKLEEAIVEVRSEVDKFRGQGAHNDSQRQKVADDLHTRLAVAEDEAARQEARFQTASRTLNALKGGVGVMWQRLGCALLNTHGLVGAGRISDDNLMLHLGVIEQRVNGLVQMYAVAQAHAPHAGGGGGGSGGGASSAAASDDGSAAIASALGSALGVGPHVPMGNGLVSVVPPSSMAVAAYGGALNDDDDNALDASGGGGDDEEMAEEREDVRPFSRDELRQRTIRAMARRDKRAAATQALVRARAEKLAAAERAAAAQAGGKARGADRPPLGQLASAAQQQPRPPSGPPPPVGDTSAPRPPPGRRDARGGVDGADIAPRAPRRDGDGAAAPAPRVTVGWPAEPERARAGQAADVRAADGDERGEPGGAAALGEPWPESRADGEGEAWARQATPTAGGYALVTAQDQ